MSENQSSYRQIMKATSIFGGVQVFQIIIGIIRSKFVAVLLGPAGMGISGLLSSTIGFISALTTFGLSTSAVRDISMAFSSADQNRLAFVTKVFRRLVWITGLLGAIITAVFSSYLSEITFGNKDYTAAFIWLSITLLVNQISAGQSVILRGTRQIKFMAQASMIGSVLGLISTIPLYYLYGVKGIVPAMIITSLTALVLTRYYANKVAIPTIFISKSQTISEGKEMLKMGFMISLSSLLAMGASYIVKIYISNKGGVEQLGLYNAGFTIVNTYVGMVFTAMATDYYPRLSAVANNNEKNRQVMNQQAEIALLILSPIVIIFLVFIKWVVILFYSQKFVPITDMIQWAALGMFFKAASWAIAFIFLAKGARKLFFWNELITNIYLLIFNVLGYLYFGLTGLGFSFLISYIIYFIQVYYVANRKYSFVLGSSFVKIFIIQFCLAVITFIITKIGNPIIGYSIGTPLIIISLSISLKGLDKRLDLRSILMIFKNKLK